MISDNKPAHSRTRSNVPDSKMSESPELLNDSELGTKDYWENIYKLEVKNLKEMGDEGEVWFGEDAMYRMIKYLDKMVERDLVEQECSIIDLGTGNG